MGIGDLFRSFPGVQVKRRDATHVAPERMLTQFHRFDAAGLQVAAPLSARECRIAG